MTPAEWEGGAQRLRDATAALCAAARAADWETVARLEAARAPLLAGLLPAPAAVAPAAARALIESLLAADAEVLALAATARSEAAAAAARLAAGGRARAAYGG